MTWVCIHIGSSLLGIITALGQLVPSDCLQFQCMHLLPLSLLQDFASFLKIWENEDSVASVVEEDGKIS